MMKYLTLGFRLQSRAVWQLQDFDFNSFTFFNGVPLAAGAGGIFELDNGDLLDNSVIDSFFQLPSLCLGTDRLKKVRHIDLGYETSGSLKMTVILDDTFSREYTLAPWQREQTEHGNRATLSVDSLGKYLAIRIDNVTGADFSVDRITAVVIASNRREVSRNVYGRGELNAPDSVPAGTGS